MDEDDDQAVRRDALPPTLKEPVRILSDFHLGHPASRIDSVEALSPLLEGAATVIVNGDASEQRYGPWRARGDELLAELHALALSLGVDLVQIRGNHDPWGGDIDWLELANGAVRVTHGDALFRHLSPWSPRVMRLRDEMDAEWAGVDRDDRDEWFGAVQRCRELKPRKRQLADEAMQERGVLLATLSHLWPPQRVAVMLRSWWVAPGRAADLCRRFWPQARFVIFGHTHWTGCWQRGGRTVINTGGYISIGSQTVVELADGRLRVLKVDRDRRSGAFSIGRQLENFEL